MFKRFSCSSTIVRFFYLVSLCFSLYINAQDQHIGWEPNSTDNVCIKDINGDGNNDDAGEAILCSEGSTYDPFVAYKNGEFAGYSTDYSPSCAHDQVSCIKESISYCPFDDNVCSGPTCQRNRACLPTSWMERRSVRKVASVYRENVFLPTPACSYSWSRKHYCPTGTSRGYSTANQCYISESNCGTYATNSSGQNITKWFCSRTSQYFDNYWSARSSCTYYETSNVRVNGFDCPVTPHNDRYTSASACAANCIETKNCEKEKFFSCPLGDSYSCVNLNNANTSDNFVCSKVQCGIYKDVKLNQPVDRNILVDDGNYDVEGNCLGSVMIFTGRAMDCRVPGVASAYQNCCTKSDDEVYNDNMGGLTETAIALETISLTYGAATAAYATYSAGGTAAEAGASASEFLAGAVDPTTAAIAVAVVIIMKYLESACPPEDIETAILDSSGYCVTLGKKCTSKWFGSCVQKAEVKCCFNSMMARIVNEQGRPQLGMNFGTPDAPRCEGFSAEQFQALDFSKIDLSEYYDEIRKNSQAEVESIMSEGITDATGG